MAKIKNILTGEIISVNNSTVRNGDLWVFNKSPKFGEKWLAKRPMLTQTDEVTGTAPNLAIKMTLGDGWEIVTGRASAPRKPRETKHGASEDNPSETMPTETETSETDTTPAKVEQEPETMPAPQSPKFNADGIETGLAQVFMPVFNQVAAQIEANIRAKVDVEMQQLKQIAEEKVRKLEITLPEGKKTKIEGLTIEGFEDMVKDLEMGYNIYMHGPAGTGKSHAAKQLAAALGLPYYEINQVEFAHEVAGYGDASGRYVETPLYKAVTEGGLLFFDEFDRSAQSATTVVNTLLANRRFTFPVIGNVEAHPNFRVVAAGNTTMTGASSEYVAANVLDASSRDRFVFYKTDYDERIELPIHAQGDKELVTFMQDLRKAIEKSHVQLVASMRATEYMKVHESDKKKAMERGLFKGMESEDIRIIYNNLSIKGIKTSWGIAMNEMC